MIFRLFNDMVYETSIISRLKVFISPLFDIYEVDPKSNVCNPAKQQVHVVFQSNVNTA